jgi:hypothetical protein
VSLTAGYLELNSALKDLRVRWEDTKVVWNDAVRRDFEENHWQPLEGCVVSTLRAIDRLAPVLIKLRQECE